MSAPDLAIVRTGVANLASVVAAFERLGVVPRLTDDPGDVRNARRVVLPGVGAFGAGMARLRELKLDSSLVERIRADRPLLAICLGMQLLCDASDESPGVEGLGIVPSRVRRFSGNVRIPQMGWNRIEPSSEAHFLKPAWMYFANSYRLDSIPAGWGGTMSNHGGMFTSAIERGSLLACQFHPELSGPDGLELLRRWLTADPEAR